MKPFVSILLALFLVSIAVPFLFTGLVYNNYSNIFPSLIVWVGSLVFLIISAILLTIFDKKSKRRYFYLLTAGFSVGLFFLSLPFLIQCSSYIFIKMNQDKLDYVISEVRDKKITYLYYKEKSKDFNKIKNILEDLEIQSVQLTSDNSVLFMEGGFMEADGWCYSESGINPEKYYDGDSNKGSDKRGFQTITIWTHSFGNWYQWIAR
jgi:hypothetical protein